MLKMRSYSLESLQQASQYKELEHGIDMDVAAHAATLSRRTKPRATGFFPVAFGANTRARSSVSPSHRGPLSRTPL